MMRFLSRIFQSKNALPPSSASEGPAPQHHTAEPPPPTFLEKKWASERSTAKGTPPERHSATAAQSAKEPPYATIDGARLSITTTASALCSALDSDKRAVFLFKIPHYAAVLADITRTLQARYGVRSREAAAIIPALVRCANCLTEYPESWRLGAVLGSTTPTVCKNCQSNQAYLVIAVFRQEDVTEADVAALARYWRQEAAAMWAAYPKATHAPCSFCPDGTLIPRPQGYATAPGHMTCERCGEKMLSEALQKLREYPEHYGMGLLQKLRKLKA